MTAPLAGRRILVTRSAGQIGKLSEGLRAFGAIPVEVPILAIVPPHSWEHLDTAVRMLDSYDWLVLTSTNTLDALKQRCDACGVDPRNATRLQVAAIGPATAEAARAMGFNVSVVPEVQVAEGLVAAFKDLTRGCRVLVPRAETARDILLHALRAAGARVDVAEAYRNALPESAPDDLRVALAEPLAAATFTSSSSVSHLAEAARLAGIPFPLDNVHAVSIGPITSHTLRDNNWPPAIEATPHDIPGLIEAVRLLFEGRVKSGV